MAQLYLSVAVSHVSVTVNQSAQYQHPETGAKRKKKFGHRSYYYNCAFYCDMSNTNTDLRRGQISL